MSNAFGTEGGWLMKYRTFGKTGVAVSEVGLGTWQLGGTEWGDVSDAAALAVLRRAVYSGVNFLDTADIYGGGRSETLIGRLLRETKTKLVLATKLGRRFDDGNGWPANFTLPVMRQHTQDSLKRLGVDSVFLQQLHCVPIEELRRGEIFDNLRALKKEGLIQNWGVSVETVEEGLLCLQHADCGSLQVIYNVFRQKLTDELLPRAKAQGVAILARVPLASGLLSGKFRHGQKFGERDHRHFNADGQAFNVGETFAGVPFDQGVDLAEKVGQLLAPQGGTTLAELALRWVLDDDAVTTVIPGATKPEQAGSNARASDLPPLGPEAHARLRDLYVREIAPLIRGPY
jgi:aryl-alcohol dehydrogenase-like predicted oxidoreductase